MTAHKIPTVTLGCGQMQIHTTSEFLDIEAFQRACEVALAAGRPRSTDAETVYGPRRRALPLLPCDEAQGDQLPAGRETVTPRSVERVLCAGTGCGWCRAYLRRLFEESRGNAADPDPDADLSAPRLCLRPGQVRQRPAAALRPPAPRRSTMVVPSGLNYRVRHKSQWTGAMLTRVVRHAVRQSGQSSTPTSWPRQAWPRHRAG